MTRKPDKRNKRIWKASRSVLRFFNLLEPDVPYMVLSLSKLSVWATMGMILYVVMSDKGSSDIIAALVANLGSVGNYAYRRHIQVKTKRGAFRDKDCEELADSADGMGPPPDACDEPASPPVEEPK
jgi:hypothetical protein